MSAGRRQHERGDVAVAVVVGLEKIDIEHDECAAFGRVVTAESVNGRSHECVH
jgi:hypothetical protein